MKTLAFTFLLLFCFTTFSQNKNTLEPKLENCAWIAGNWKGEAFGGQVEENWSKPSGGSMMATFKLINDGEVSFYEIEIIREIENSLVLQLKHFDNDLKGWETKNETVDFPLKEITENRVVFEGMSFEKVSDTEMNVFVDIKNEEGVIQIVKFNYHKTVSNQKVIKDIIKVKKANQTLVIDGKADEQIWSQTEWLPIDKLWLGKPFNNNDFEGRYKLTWTNEALYLLAEIEDDKLVDNHEDPLEKWWDDDCLEIFVDADNSGGNHQFNHNAFAYHVALNGDVVDMSINKKGKLFNHHIESKLRTTKNTSIWEVKILLFDDSYLENSNNVSQKLSENKNIGFALAYCDNDSSGTREHFIGSVTVEGDNKNRGWIDANIFGTLLLINEN